MKKVVQLSLALAMAMGLSACGGGGSGSGTVVTPPPPTPLEDKFGTGFGADFRIAANNTPANVAAGDVIPVDPAATPVALH